MAFNATPVQSVKGASTSSTATATLVSPTVGNLLIASVAANIATDTLAITDWTKDPALASGSSNISIFYRISDGTESTVTVTGSSTITKIHVYEFSGGANPVRVDIRATQSNTTNTTASTASITNTYANCLIFASITTQGSITAGSFSAPYTTGLQDAATMRLLDGYQVVSASAAQQATASWTTTQITRTAIIAFKDAGANTTPNGNFLQFM